MTDHQAKYLSKVEHRLRREGFTVQPEYAGLLPIEKDAHRVCNVNAHGNVSYDPDHVRRNGLEDALDQVRCIADETLTYTKQMAVAPPLAANGLSGDYRLLAEFDNIVLAGHEREGGYIATREGAQRIDPGKMDLPATEKQVIMVEKLVREFPQSCDLEEYADYQDSPTRGNASEFITRAVEDNLDQIAKMENYVDYIAKRPRAQRFGSHGLFTSGDEPLTLTKIQDEVAHHPGTVWMPIISLRREDAARLGFDNAERWKDFLSSFSVEMAQAMKIPLEQFRWYAAFHDEKHHPHVHMVCYSADGKSGFLTERGIERIKSGLAKGIFRQELTEIYAKQTQRRDSLNQDTQKALRQLVQQMQDGTLSNERIERLMMELSHQLRNTSGKKQYGYLKPSVKSLVDEIVNELERDERVATAYNLWYEMREEVLRTYKDDLPERIPLSQQKEFKKIKNIVIQEAVRLGAELEQNHAAPTSPNTAAVQRNDGHSSAPLFNSVTRLLHHMGRIFQEQQLPASPVYHTDRKLLQKLREKKMAQGHKPDDHAPKLS